MGQLRSDEPSGTQHDASRSPHVCKSHLFGSSRSRSPVSFSSFSGFAPLGWFLVIAIAARLYGQYRYLLPESLTSRRQYQSRARVSVGIPSGRTRTLPYHVTCTRRRPRVIMRAQRARATQLYPASCRGDGVADYGSANIIRDET